MKTPTPAADRPCVTSKVTRGRPRPPLSAGRGSSRTRGGSSRQELSRRARSASKARAAPQPPKASCQAGAGTCACVHAAPLSTLPAAHHSAGCAAAACRCLPPAPPPPHPPPPTPTPPPPTHTHHPHPTHPPHTRALPCHSPMLALMVSSVQVASNESLREMSTGRATAVRTRSISSCSSSLQRQAGQGGRGVSGAGRARRACSRPVDTGGRGEREACSQGGATWGAAKWGATIAAAPAAPIPSSATHRTSPARPARRATAGAPVADACALHILHKQVHLAHALLIHLYLAVCNPAGAVGQHRWMGGGRGGGEAPEREAQVPCRRAGSQSGGAAHLPTCASGRQTYSGGLGVRCGTNFAAPRRALAARSEQIRAAAPPQAPLRLTGSAHSCCRRAAQRMKNWRLTAGPCP